MRDSLRVSGMIIAAVALLVASAAPMLAAGTSSMARAQPSLALARAFKTPGGSVSTPAPSLVATAPAVATEAAAATALETPSEVLAMPAPAQPPVNAVSNAYRITIPRLGIDLQIREGDLTRDIVDQRTPENYAFHLPGSAWPGQNGNTFLYAHARRGMFLSLWNARPGDEVFVLSPDGRVLAYVVRDVLPRVTPSDVSSTQPTAAERLTLQTSTGPSASDPRFVVFAFPRGG